ncbi:MAG: RagB/SusD family nutrient uptake outer membrane protein [Ginsengibacter sp.]
MKTRIMYLLRYSLLSVVILLSFSCSKKLEEKPISSVPPSSFGNSVLQIEAAYAGSMNYLWNYWEGYGYAYGPFVNDDQLNNGDLTIPADNADDLWNRHYMALLNINNALGSIKSGNIKGETQETLDGLEGQGKFLRAHNYFMLVRMFGGVPLITEDTPDPILNPMARASVADVYGLIVSDLTFAAAHLPESWDGAPGKPTSGAAKGILAKAYLAMATYPLNDPSNYQKAADVALEVMTSGTYHLVDSVDQVFSLNNKYGPEMMWSYNSTYDDIATDPEIWTTEDYFGAWGDAAVDTSFEHRWPDQKRKEAYLFTDWGGKHYTDFPEQVPYCKKFFFYISADDFQGYSSIVNYPIIRYADVLLIYAEAANMASGGGTAPQNAVDAINLVINRANGFVPNAGHPLLTTSMTKAAFDAAVIQERSWELMFENCDRWFDICRKRILDDPNVTVRAADRANFTEDDYLFPIPETDLRINKMLIQNPGYPTP